MSGKASSYWAILFESLVAALIELYCWMLPIALEVSDHSKVFGEPHAITSSTIWLSSSTISRQRLTAEAMLMSHAAKPPS